MSIFSERATVLKNSTNGNIFSQRSNVLKNIGKERMLPGQKSRWEKEAQATPEELINMGMEEDLMPEYSDVTKEVPEQFSKAALESLGGSYGSIADFLKLQTKEKALPGQEARWKREAEATPEELIAMGTEEDIVPDYARLPSTSEIREMTQRPEPTTRAGRYAARTGSAAGGAVAFGASPAVIAGSMTGGVAGQTAREVGAPEWVATPIDIATSIYAGGKPTLKSKAVVKPSGLPVRKFQKITKQTKVTPEIRQKIVEGAVEDLNQAAYKIMEGNKTFRGMKQLPDFEKRLNSAFADVREIASEIEEPIAASVIEKNLPKVSKEPAKGYAKSEYEKIYDSYLNKQRERIPLLERKKMTPELRDEMRSVNTELKNAKQNYEIGKGKFTPELETAFKKRIKVLEKKKADLPYQEKKIPVTKILEQYRKNNGEVSDVFNMTKPKAYNRAKRDALLEHNRAIGKTFEQKLPDDPLTHLFKLTNSIHHDMRNIQEIESFLEKIGESGINFKAAQNYYKTNKI
ncbi:MAG: hypothetical protein IMZ64_05010, partial [Bacteroidetes bacterium]|nr:hypothetical protein [Bacteroidota bacterium]